MAESGLAWSMPSEDWEVVDGLHKREVPSKEGADEILIHGMEGALPTCGFGSDD